MIMTRLQVTLCLLSVSIAFATAAVGERFFSPYVDATLYPITLVDDIAEETGVKLFTLGFIVGNSSEPCTPTWGNYYNVEEGPYSWNSTLEREDYLYDHIKVLRENGGDVIVSFGGLAGTPLFDCTDQSALYQALKQVCDAVNVTYLDFDIEGPAQQQTDAVTLLAGASKQLQTETNVRVSLTLPVLPSGLTNDGLGVYKIFLSAAVKIDSVNIMSMDFGDSVAPPGTPMSTYIIQSMEATSQQIGSNDSVGVTPMIGLNDVPSESTTLDDAAKVTEYAKMNNYRSIGMWSANRDHPCNDTDAATHCSSICNNSKPCQTADYQYMETFNQFVETPWTNEVCACPLTCNFNQFVK